jgi:hypothetical protein
MQGLVWKCGLTASRSFPAGIELLRNKWQSQTGCKQEASGSGAGNDDSAREPKKKINEGTAI